MNPAESLASRLEGAGSPLIEKVDFRPQTVIDPPEVRVVVRPGVTDREAQQLWCDLIVPAGGSRFEGNTGTVIVDDAGNWLAVDWACE